MKNLKVNVRLIVQCVLCFLLGRVTFLGICPVAVSVFTIVLSEKRKRNPLIWAVVCGLVSVLLPFDEVSGGSLVRYSLIFMSILIIDRLAANRKIYMGRRVLTCVSAGVTTVISICGGLLDIAEYLPLAIGEGILIIVLANVLYIGIHLTGFGRLSQMLSNEQLISVIIMLSFAANGLPEVNYNILSVTDSVLYVIVIYISYKYGAAAGAIAGVAAGISASVQGQNASLIGMYCLVGISTGIVNEIGKWASVVAFLISGIAVGILYPQGLWDAVHLRAFLSAAVCFIFLPESILAVDGEMQGENVLVKHSLKQETSQKLNEFARAFEMLSETFAKNGAVSPVINQASASEIFNELTSTVCGACVNCNYCWEQKYYDTYHETLKMLGSAESNGRIRREDVSVDFAARCIHFDDFMRETNQQLEITRISMGYINRFAENRAMLAEQMKEVSVLISELEQEVVKTESIEMHEEAELLALLRAYGIKVKKLAFIEKRNGKIEICMCVKSGRGTCITLKETADIISDVMGCRWKPDAGYASVMPKEYTIITFVKDVKYRVLTGIARIAKNGEEVSGDNYSFLTLSNGKVIMTITDGMGSGRNAYEESETVIEMIEQLVEAGFREEMALRFVNSTMIFARNEDIFSTVDISVIDLNSGVCECIKCGAAATFIKKRQEVLVVNSNAMPVGILPEAVPEESRHKLCDGDLIIMISDGVSDSFSSGDEEYELSRLIREWKSDNPQELAEYILDEANKRSLNKNSDDMSVLVAGLWYKV